MSDTSKVSNMVPTADGSLTLRDADTREYYHNYGGAFLEAMQSYVYPAGLEDLLQRRKGTGGSTIKVLDSCFGLGYNTLALWQHILNSSHLPIDKVETTAIELDVEMIKVLIAVLQQDCFKTLLNALRDQNGKTIVDNLQVFDQIGVPPRSLQLNYQVSEGPQYVLNLHFSDLREKVPQLGANQSECGTYDLIFHDPFSPGKMPYLWTVDIFKHYFKLLREEAGRFLTYSAASAVRGGLREAGFDVFRTRGVGEKKGGTLASCGFQTELVDEMILPLLPEEAERMDTASGIPYRDPQFNSTIKEILRRREAEQNEFKAAHR